MEQENKKTLKIISEFFVWNRGDVIRTRGLYVPNVALYQAEPHPAVAIIFCTTKIIQYFACVCQ